MVWSYVLFAENYDNPHASRREAIEDFSAYAVDTVVGNDSILDIARQIQQTGIKDVDALHMACAVYAGCDYFVTCDDRMLKYKGGQISVIDPIDFIKIWEGRVRP